MSPKKNVPIPATKPVLPDTQALLKRNIELSEKIIEQNEKIRRRLTVMVVSGYIRLFLILAPLIVGLYYLPQIINEAVGYISGTTQTQDGSALHQLIQSIDQSDLQQLLENINR